MRRWVLIVLGSLCAIAIGTTGCSQQETIAIGSKLHTEQHILGEILAQSLESAGYQVDRRFNLGGTKIVYNALVAGEIDAYVEYSGTIQEVILKSKETLSLSDITERLEEEGIRTLTPLGFNNSYAIGVHSELAAARQLQSISDLADHTDLRFYFSHEFLEREDGYPGLSARYQLPQSASGIEHSVALRAIVEREIDVTDLYTTDAEIEYYDLVTLEDDRGYFPKYLAVPLIRTDLSAAIKSHLSVAAGAIDNATMVRLNYEVHINQRSASEVAQDFLNTIGIQSTVEETTVWQRLFDRSMEHLYLASIALIAATIVALSVSFICFRSPLLAKPLTYIAGLLQTIPSLALVALMVPLFGIGMLPAIIALFLYSLLPIIRTTVTALANVDPLLIQVAEGTGFTRPQVLRLIQIPLSLPAMLAGIRIAAVICIGTATLAAFIGGGGLGDLIFQGLQLDDTRLIVLGACTAALMAIVVELLFEGLEKWLVPGHIASASQTSHKEYT